MEFKVQFFCVGAVLCAVLGVACSDDEITVDELADGGVMPGDTSIVLARDATVTLDTTIVDADRSGDTEAPDADAASDAGDASSIGDVSDADADDASGMDDADADAAADADAGDAGVCSGNTTECGARCVDTMVDFFHCGRCGNECAQDESCTSGACVAN